MFIASTKNINTKYNFTYHNIIVIHLLFLNNITL